MWPGTKCSCLSGAACLVLPAGMGWRFQGKQEFLMYKAQSL